MPPAARRSDARDRRCALLRRFPGETVNVTALTGGNPDLDADRRTRVQARRQLAAVRENRPAPARRIMSTRPSTTRISSFPGPARARSGLSPTASSAMPTASWSASTSARSISTNRAATRFAGASISPSRSNRRRRRRRRSPHCASASPPAGAAAPRRRASRREAPAPRRRAGRRGAAAARRRFGRRRVAAAASAAGAAAGG